MTQERTFTTMIRLLVLLCATTGVIAAALLMTALRPSLPKTIEARKFVLRDSVGRVRAELSVDTAGNAALFFLDSLGRKKAVLK
jgi:hypothetical protein